MTDTGCGEPGLSFPEWARRFRAITLVLEAIFTAAPEPATLVLVASGLLALLVMTRVAKRGVVEPAC